MNEIDIEIETKNRILELFEKLEITEFVTRDSKTVKDKISVWSKDLECRIQAFKQSFRSCYIYKDDWQLISQFIKKTTHELILIDTNLELYKGSLAIINRTYTKELLKYVSSQVINEGEVTNTNDLTTSNMPKSNFMTYPKAALICYYQGIRSMTRAEAKKIVKRFGKNSGDSLYNSFISFRKEGDRRGLSDIKRSDEHKLELLQSVFEYFTGDEAKQKLVLADLCALKSAMSKY